MLCNIFSEYGRVIFFDTETTGLDAKQCRIIEFAAICVDKRGVRDIIDEFVRLPEGKHIPGNIVELTNITDEMLKKNGITEEKLAEKLKGLFAGSEKTLLVAHNAQFDLSFLQEFMKRNPVCGTLDRCDFLDTLSVYRDRAPFPHKLSDAIGHYGLKNKVQNTHRAIDDVAALYEITKAMLEEDQCAHRCKCQVSEYINLFGYNPKYGISGSEIEGIRYIEQNYSDFREGICLPEKI